MTTEKHNAATAPSIVVGYDGSETARRAVAWAVRCAGEDGKVYVVHSYGPPPDWLGAPGYQRLLGDHQARGKAILDELALEGGDGLVDVDYELELIGGDPAEAIVDFAKARDVDEIVIGSRGFGYIRAALGSVSHGVIQRADRPVVVIPAQ